MKIQISRTLSSFYQIHDFVHCVISSLLLQFLIYVYFVRFSLVDITLQIMERKSNIPS